MAEEFQQCHLWPQCEIHLGKPAPRWFSPENVAEMREMREAGVLVVDIAEKFGTHHQTVSELLNGKRKWQRIAKRKGQRNANDQ